MINIGLVWISLLAMLKGPLDLRGNGMGKKITLSDQTLKYRQDLVVQFRVRNVTGALM